ncbi:MAG: helix-turn-helix transcriptional regulator [Planctomycetes bacterium]|nr:helix-turn-helix transcriptional regulator [Planctomycetota bacterium]
MKKSKKSPEDLDALKERIAGNLRRFREISKGGPFTQRRLSEEAGINPKTLYRMESTTSPYKIEDLARVAWVLGIPIEDLIRTPRRRAS